jgi:hypothetical protein
MAGKIEQCQARARLISAARIRPFCFDLTDVLRYVQYILNVGVFTRVVRISDVHGVSIQLTANQWRDSGAATRKQLDRNVIAL